MPPRQYIRRTTGFVHEGVFVQTNPYLVGHGTLDGDELYGDKEFASLDELMRVAQWSGAQMTAFIERLKTLTQ